MLNQVITGWLFSTLELVSSYWQIQINTGDKEKIGYVTNLGLYQFRAMSFWLSGAPSSFQPAMGATPAGLQ